MFINNIHFIKQKWKNLEANKSQPSEISKFIEIEYKEFSKSEMDVAFGLIVGSIYSTFLQTYANQQLTIGLDDIQEFHDFIKSNADQIIESLGKNQDS